MQRYKKSDESMCEGDERSVSCELGIEYKGNMNQGESMRVPNERGAER